MHTVTYISDFEECNDEKFFDCYKISPEVYAEHDDDGFVGGHLLRCCARLSNI